jgi:adenosylcobinamide-GDP ribazoletransferase
MFGWCRWDRTFWQGLWSAIQFLSIIPACRELTFNARSALPFFPIVGLLIGAVLACIHAITGIFWPGQVVALLDVITLAVLTGALHLDGLADTADGLYGQRDPETAMAIMKDSRIGAMGTVSVICCLAVKWAGLAHISSPHAVWLLLVPAYARASVLFGIRSLPYGRPQGGTGFAFFREPIQTKDFWGIGLIFCASFFAGWGFVSLNLGFALLVFLTLKWYRKKIGCITGDMLGAMIEMTEAGLFLCAAARWGV